ncbi:hypothetical protein ONE63_010258 [Megalurothrips usitatus]|uniref:Uncharacterized protein n=1 Tax=Megalurothrips usitatus TaxID=439358 RepID=A0AAV7XHA0_9NEOP|nr:hypothetical protein ONE63_010258 [Megalurothrips usitatus]
MSSRSTLLNGHVLAIDNGGGLPALTPLVRQSGGGDRETTLVMPPHSMAFFVFPGVHGRACESAPPSTAEAGAGDVLLQLSPTDQGMHVQFDVEGLTQPSKSKTKDKLAATVKSADRRRNVLHETTPRAKRASPAPAPHPPRPGPVSPEDFLGRLAKTHAAHVKQRKHLAGPGAAHAPTTDKEEDEDQFTTIPVAHIWRPDDLEADLQPAAHKPGLRKLPAKPFKLPKRAPLVPSAPRLPKKPAPPRIKPIPRGVAVVSSLVDPQRGVSAEDSAEEEAAEEDHFPTGEVMAELGDSNEEEDSSAGGDEGFDYLSDDENDGEEETDEEGSKKGATTPGYTLDDDKDTEKSQFYFGPGEFMAALKNSAAGPKQAAGRGGEIGELDMSREPVTVPEQSTPPPYEPHLEAFVPVPPPAVTVEQQRLARQRAHQDMESAFYQGTASAARETKNTLPLLPPLAPPPGEQDLNTDLLIELGKRYLREKKMALKRPQPRLDESSCEQGRPSAPSAPSAPGEDEDLPPRQVRTRRQATAVRLALPTGASPRPRPRLRVRPSEDASSRQFPRDVRRELEQRITERRERLDKARESARDQPERALPRPRESDRSDRERAMARTREQLEQQRQQREQTERERLMEAREQLERAREQRDQQARAQQREESLAKAREQLDQQRQQREQQLEQQIRQMREQREQAGRQMRGHERGPLPLPGLRRTERVKRHTASDAASKYMDSFGWSEAQLPHRLQAGAHRVVPAPVHHHHHHNLHHPGLGSTFTSTRYKYGHAPQNVRKNVRHQVVKKTNVVRYVPVDEQPARASAEDHVVARPPSYARLPAATHRRQQVYRPNDNVATMWANSPLSPLRQYGGVQRQSNVQDDADSGSYEQGSPDVPGAALLAVDIDAGDDVPSSPAVETKTVPTEVKTTSIVKTERTYQSPEQDGGYSSESCLDADQEAGSAQFASLEPEAPTYLRAHQHHGHHHHHHRIGDSTPISSYGGVSAEEEGSATDYGAAGREAPKETSFIKEEETSSTEYGWKSAEVQTAADAAEGSEAEEPMPEFPFRTPPGGKGQVVGFTDDDSSPGGWYTFSSEPRRGPSEAPAAELEEYDDRLDPSDSYSTSPARRPAPQAHLEQGGTGRSWSVPLSHIGRKNPSSAGEASYSSGGEEAAGSGQRQHHASSYADSSTGHTAPSQERPAGLAPHDEQQYSAPQPQETAQEPAEPAPYGHNEPTEQAAPAVSYTRDHSSHQPQAPSGQGRSGETLSEYGSHTRDYNAPHPHQKSPVEPEQQASAVQSSYTFSSNGYNAPRPHQPVPAPHEQPAPPVQSSYSSNSNGYNAPTPHQPGPAPHEQPALPIQSSYSVYSNGHNSATRYQQPAPAVQGEQSSAVQSSYTSNSNGYNAPRPHQPVPFSHEQPAPPVQSSYSSYSNGYNSAPAPVEQEQQPTAVQSSYTSNSNGYNAPTPHQPAPAQQEQPTPPVQSSYSNGYYAPGPHQPAPGEHEQQSSAVKSSYTSYSNGYSGVPRPPQTAPAAQEQQSSPVQSSYTSDGYSGVPSPPHQAPVQQEQQSLGIQSSYTSNSNGYDSAPGPRQQSPPDSSSYAAYSNGYSPPSADASAPAVQEERSPAIPPNADSAPQPQTAASAALEQPAFGYEPASSGFAVPKLQAPATLAPPVFEPGQPASSFVTYSNGYSAPRPQAPIPWGGSNSGSALEATLESDATSATRPRAQPQSHRPRRPAQRKQPAQQPLLPPAFAYLSKYFQPVGGAKVDPVGRSPKTADDLWKQPAPAADDLWKQPAPADDLWKEPTPGEDLWKEPTPGEDLWKEPTPGGDLWKQPTQQRPSSALWGKQAPSPAADDADDSLDIWGQPIAKAVRAQAPAPSAQRSQQASLGAPSAEQLLDYNTAILRRNSNAAAPARTAPALMASLAPGGSNAYAVRRPAALRRRRSLHEPAAAPASAAHRSPRGILDVLGGSGKISNEVPDSVNDDEWSAETERMRRKKQERQKRRREQDLQQESPHIQLLGGKDGVLSGVFSSLLGKVAGVIGYLGRLTQTNHI